MKNKKVFFLISCLLCLIWMTVIFAFSSQPVVESAALSGGIVKEILIFIGIDVDNPDNEMLVHFLDQCIRKMAHFSEYAVLGALLVNTFRLSGCIYFYIPPILCGMVYAISDEVHQIFVDGRGAAVTDVMIDSGGAAIGASIAYVVIMRAIKKRQQKITESSKEKKRQT